MGTGTRRNGSGNGAPVSRVKWTRQVAVAAANAAQVGVSRSLFTRRLRAGWTLEEAAEPPLRTGRLYEFRGDLLNVAQIAARTGLTPGALAMRLHRGQSIETATGARLGRYRSARVVVQGRLMSLPDASRATGVPLSTLRRRLERGWTDAEITAPVRPHR